MGGVVIAFPIIGASNHSRAGKTSLPRGRKRPKLKLQFERITALLDELEDLTRSSRKLSPRMLTQARNRVFSARHVLELHDDVIRAAQLGLGPDGDPQPHVDPEALDRFFNSQDKHQ